MDAADPLRAKVRTAVSPVPVYPYQRIGAVPVKHVQMYAGSEALGRAAMAAEYTDIVYVHLYAEKESEVKAMREQVRFLDARTEPGDATAGCFGYSLQSATTQQELDGTMHIAILLQATYVRQVSYTA